MSTQQITLEGEVVGGSPRTLASLDYAALMSTHPLITEWFSVRPEKATLIDPAVSGGTVTDLSSMTDGSSGLLEADPPTLQRPNHSLSDAAFNNRMSIIHDTGGTGDRLYYSGSFPVGGDFFKAALVNFSSAPSALGYMGISSAGTGNRHLFAVNATQFMFRCGESSVEAFAGVPFATGTKLVIGSWNAALKRARITIDDGVTIDEDISASAVVDVASGCFAGHNINGKVKEHWWGPVDILDDSTESNELLAIITGYSNGFIIP